MVAQGRAIGERFLYSPDPPFQSRVAAPLTRREGKPMRSLAFACLLLLLILPAASPAWAHLPTQQGRTTVTIRVEVIERTRVQMVVDGSTVVDSVLQAGAWQEWTGRSVTVRAESGASVRVLVNGTSVGALGASGEAASRSWQADGSSTPASPAAPVPTVAVPPAAPPPAAAPPASAPTEPRRSVTERMTLTARYAAPTSPFYRRTWVTYYGRPNVPVMGILGEYSLDDLVPRLQEQAAAYDEANGPEIGVLPAFHLVYGMATKGPGDDGTHLIFLSDEVVQEYIERAKEEGIMVILDIQVGAMEPVEAMRVAFPYLQHDNVHLALDPEFAMSHPDQERPGNPIGFVTAEQVNAVQVAMRDYLREQGIRGRRVLVLHQFMDTMIVNKSDLARVYRVDLTITADGFGGPWPKISKYNEFVDSRTKFAGLKLFYRWDEPLMTEREVLGIDRHPGTVFIEVTPNLVIYQ